MKIFPLQRHIVQGLRWGLWMYLITTFVSPLIFGDKIRLTKILIGIPLWFVAGLLVSRFYKSNPEKK
ncbi:MAG: hypothetical protein JNK41_02650 [Saprospiraceae bacterium]|nr:hypothetical protein [Saprospiraceae bacterium]